MVARNQPCFSYLYVWFQAWPRHHGLSRTFLESYFCNRQFMATAFLDNIKGAYDSDHILTLVPHLSSLNIPSFFCYFISWLFHHRSFFFNAPFHCISYLGLPEGSALSPIFLNIYFLSVIQSLSSKGFQTIAYADDLKMFSVHKDIDFAIAQINSALVCLSTALHDSYSRQPPRNRNSSRILGDGYPGFSYPFTWTASISLMFPLLPI